MYSCIKLDKRDLVATVTKKIKSGEKVRYCFEGKNHTVTAGEDIPIYHKIALADIKKGSAIYKYGYKIGIALKDIKKGEHVHTENLDSKLQEDNK